MRVNNDYEHSFRCSGCHEDFQKPLLAMDSSNGRIQVYYACPHCLSKVESVKEHKSEEEKAESPALIEDTRKNVKAQEEMGCKHFLGYLRKRPKGMAIPEECLVCEKMIECLTH